VVVALTNSTIACFAGPSFHEGRGSWARVVATPQANAINTKPMGVNLVFDLMDLFLQSSCQKSLLISGKPLTPTLSPSDGERVMRSNISKDSFALSP
jgi:hypothetical protein